LDFPFSPSSFNFNFDEKCYLHAQYLLLPTSPVAQQNRSFSIACERGPSSRLFLQVVKKSNISGGFSRHQARVYGPTKGGSDTKQELFRNLPSRALRSDFFRRL
jgi:hypothetical protein